MKKTLHIRLLSILLLLTMMVSFCPAVFANAEDVPADAGYEDELETGVYEPGDSDKESVPSGEPEQSEKSEPADGFEPADEPDSAPGSEEPDGIGTEDSQASADESAIEDSAEPEDKNENEETDPPADGNGEENAEETEAEDAEADEAAEPLPVLLHVVSTQELSFTLSDAAGVIAPATEEEIAACIASVYSEEDSLSGQVLTDADASLPDSADGEVLAADAEEIVFCADYLLAPGCYSWTAEAEGFPAKASAFEVTEETPWGTTITVTLESELPYGFKGMPAGYELSKAELARKQKLIDNDVVSTLETLTPGTDYREGEIMFFADSGEYAELVAEAYCADLKGFYRSFAVAVLREATTLEAVTAGADMDLPLPAVEANHTSRAEPILKSGGREGDFSISSGEATPARMSWKAWRDYLNEQGKDMDPMLANPTASMYQWMHDMVNSYEAWGVTRGGGVTVAVIDSGVDAAHPDFGGCVQEASGAPFTGYADTHGTHVAGIIAARVGNEMGGAGIAPEAGILSIRAADDDSYYSDEDIARAIDLAVDYRVNIINLSLEDHWYNYTVENSLRRAIDSGITVVASMGNQYSNIKSYPAAYDIKGLIAVGSVAETGARSFFSSYGAWQDVSAPGSYIWSTIPGSTYDYYDGTSMAAPVVAGACALYMSYYGNPGPAAMEAAVKRATTNGIIDVSKFFSKDTAAPAIGFKDSAGNDVLPVSGRIFYGTYLQISTPDLEDDEYLLYTLDGKNPAVKNGVVTVGNLYYPKYNEDGELLPPNPVPITRENGFKIGSKVTIKAARVNGLGVVSKVASKTITVDYAAPGSIEIIDSPKTYLAAGKSYSFKAAVHPANREFDGDTAVITDADVLQSVTWEIDWAQTAVSVSPKTAAINPKTGLLKTGVSDSGQITVRAMSAGFFDEKTFEIKQLTVKSVVLDEPKKVLYLWAHSDDALFPKEDFLSATAYNAAGEALIDADGSLVNFSYTSSNKKVAAVNEEGLVTAVGKGKATITVKALDGSNASAKYTLEVRQLVNQVNLSGPKYIAPGKSATYKATVSPSGASSKKVQWSLSDGAPAGVTIDAKGKLTVPAYAPLNARFSITAKAADSAGSTEPVEFSLPVTILWTAAGVSIDVADFYSAEGELRTALPGDLFRTYKKGVLTQANLLSVQPDVWSTRFTFWDDVFESEDLSEYACTELKLDFKVSGLGGELPSDFVTWSSSSSKVATIDENGIVHAKSPGTTTITCKLNDQSGKKASAKIRVINPVSFINIKSGSASDWDDSLKVLSIGKSVSNKVILGDTFGKPSITKVKWSYQVYVFNRDSIGSDRRIDIENAIYVNKWVSVNSSGKLTVKNSADLKDLANQYAVRVAVFAESTDGCKRRGYCEYMLTPSIKKIGLDDFYDIGWENAELEDMTTVYLSAYGKTSLTISASQYQKIAVPLLWWPQGRGSGYSFEPYNNANFNITVKSSNPSVAGAIANYPDEDRFGIQIFTNGGKTGTAKITVTEITSGKKATITVKVK